MPQIPNMNWMGDQPTGSAYDVYQYYLGGGSPGGTTPTSGGGGGGGGITSLPWYLQTGGGNDGYKGGGKWGNLDLSKSKTFDKNVYSRDMINMSPMQAVKEGLTTPTNSWQNKQVQGFYNPTLGHYQTFEGKNINHLGIEVPTIAGMLFDKDLGKGPQIGDIEGTFTHGWKSGKDKIKEGWEDEKDKWSKIFGTKKRKAKKEEKLQKEIKDYNERKWKEAQAEKEKAAQTKQQWQQDYSNWQSPSGRDHAATAGIGSKESKQGAAPGQKGASKDWRAEGGMVKDLTKDPEYRGWKKMYEMNPELGSMHNKHPAFIKFYKQHERDQKKFGGLAGLLYG